MGYQRGLGALTKVTVFEERKWYFSREIVNLIRPYYSIDFILTKLVPTFIILVLINGFRTNTLETSVI